MALNTPTTQSLSDNIVSSIQASMNISVPLLPKSFTRVLAKSIAAVLVLLYKYSGFIFLQMFVQHASAEDTTISGVTVNPLQQWGELVGVGARSPGTASIHDVAITVTNQSGSIPAGTQLIDQSTGVIFLLQTSVALTAPTVIGSIMAVSSPNDGDGTGVIGNTPAGNTISFVSPQANVQTDTVVSTTTVQGADIESVSSYRQRIIDRFQKPPQGGAASDYKGWGEEVSGIINVYPYADPLCGGTVLVYVEATVASSGSPDGIPTTAQLQAVLDSIELDVSGLASRRPINAQVNALPITRIDPPIEIFGLSAPDVAQTQLDIIAKIQEFGETREPFIFGLNTGPRVDRIARSAISAIIEGVVSNSGGTFSSVILREPIGLTAVQLIILGNGEKAKFTNITFLP